MSKKYAIVHKVCKKTESRNFIEIDFGWHISGAQLPYEVEFETEQTILSMVRSAIHNFLCEVAFLQNEKGNARSKTKLSIVRLEISMFKNIFLKSIFLYLFNKHVQLKASSSPTMQQYDSEHRAHAALLYESLS